ncbi:MAG: fumarylacetoacetate hydrolase family protein [Solirubrobacterales bacterium]
MNICVFGPDRRLGIVEGEQVIDLAGVAPELPTELGEFIAAGDDALAAAAAALSRAREEGGPPARPLAEVELHPPIAARARMMMAGDNYAGHAAGAAGSVEADAEALERARAAVREVGLRGFVSFVENCVGAGDDIVIPARTDQLDFEGEVAVVIGRRCKDVKAADAAAVIWGALLLDDVSARRAIPKPDNPSARFARDKNFDSSKCLGPYVVAAELDPQDIAFETRVNGELRQSGNSAEMIFSFAEMIEFLSQDLTLLPGDVISGGTPSGTVMDSTPVDPEHGRDPAAFLGVGDVIEVSSPVLGTLRNEVVAKEGS